MPKEDGWNYTPTFSRLKPCSLANLLWCLVRSIPMSQAVTACKAHMKMTTLEVFWSNTQVHRIQIFPIKLFLLKGRERKEWWKLTDDLPCSGWMMGHTRRAKWSTPAPFSYVLWLISLDQSVPNPTGTVSAITGNAVLQLWKLWVIFNSFLMTMMFKNIIKPLKCM